MFAKVVPIKGVLVHKGLKNEAENLDTTQLNCNEGINFRDTD